MIERTSVGQVNDMMAMIRAYQNKAAIPSDNIQAPKAPTLSGVQAAAAQPAALSFTDSVRHLIEQVNTVQTQSAALQSAYLKGESVPLTDVVLGMQKSSLAFEATVQIRNKVLRAYEEIMNMPV